MLPHLESEVAFITGAARGQGRAHAVTMACAGANIVALDICHNLPYPRYTLATRADLAETVRLVEALGRKALPIVADVRNAQEMETAVTGIR
jgi:NAD(P)-dependent dehydrogenase (short-subunit alcohol dehydrogenase family)